MGKMSEPPGVIKNLLVTIGSLFTVSYFHEKKIQFDPWSLSGYYRSRENDSARCVPRFSGGF